MPTRRPERASAPAVPAGQIIDLFNGMRAKERTRELSPGELATVLARTRAGFHRAVAGMARAGNDVVDDYVLSEPWRMLDCLTVLDGLDVVFVGVRCPEPELARRELARVPESLRPAQSCSRPMTTKAVHRMAASPK